VLCLPRRLAAPILIFLITSAPFDAQADSSPGEPTQPMFPSSPPRPLSPIDARAAVIDPLGGFQVGAEDLRVVFQFASPF